MKLQAPAILKNKYVLYVLLVLAIINVLGYVALQDYDSLALFVAVGVLSTYFSKNMAVNLLLAIAVTSLIAINKRVVEGMKNKEEDDEVEEKPKKKAKKGKKEGMKEGNSPEVQESNLHVLLERYVTQDSVFLKPFRIMFLLLLQQQ